MSTVTERKKKEKSLLTILGKKTPTILGNKNVNSSIREKQNSILPSSTNYRVHLQVLWSFYKQLILMISSDPRET